jgi:hypothetical protein
MWFIWLAFGDRVSVGIELYEGIELPDVCYRIQLQAPYTGSRYGESVNEQSGKTAGRSHPTLGNPPGVNV